MSDVKATLAMQFAEKVLVNFLGFTEKEVDQMMVGKRFPVSSTIKPSESVHFKLNDQGFLTGRLTVVSYNGSHSLSMTFLDGWLHGPQVLNMSRSNTCRSEVNFLFGTVHGLVIETEKYAKTRSVYSFGEKI